jgi:type IX secretion system PorP/SprF family membrane protein
MRLRNITLIFLVFLTGRMNAQQSPIYSQYMLNKFLLNPAIAGSTGYTFINMAAREQYTAFKNAPRTFSLTAQSRMLDDSYIRRRLILKKNENRASTDTRVGLGGHIFSDRNGLVTKTGMQVTYAYHINFNNRVQLSMGLTGSGYQFKLDDSESYLHNSYDPLLSGERKSFFVPDASFGFYLTDNKFYTGMSMTDILGSSLKLGKDNIKGDYRTLRHYTYIAGYKFKMDNGFALEPSTLVRYTQMFTTVDFSMKAFYQESYWLGLSYRTNQTLVSMVGLTMDIFYFGYAFDSSFGSLSTYASGSHEIMLGVKFGDSSTRRFRWVRKDAIDYNL